MKKKLIITKRKGIIFSALLNEDNKALEICIDDTRIDNIVDNIYVARVQNVMPGIHASFVEYKKNKMAFIPDILKEGDRVVVQIVKDSISGKEPVASRHPVLTGKYVILTSRHPGLHFSYKFKDEEKKKTISDIYEQKNIEDCGFIIRTKARFVDDNVILDELDDLYLRFKELFKDIDDKKIFSELYRSAPSYIQLITNSRRNEFSEVVTDDENVYEEIRSYLKNYHEDDRPPVRKYENDVVKLSVVYGLDKQLHEAFSRKVFLPSGGYLIIDHTEALTVIDVNSGSDVTNKPSSEHYLSINIEAAREAARQIRLRNISGIILIDFINMSKFDDKKMMLEEFKKYLDKDPMGPNVVDMTKLGIVEITRKRAKKPLAEEIDERFFE